MIKRLFGSNLTNNLVGIYLFKVTMETLFFKFWTDFTHWVSIIKFEQVNAD